MNWNWHGIRRTGLWEFGFGIGQERIVELVNGESAIAQFEELERVVRKNLTR